MYQKIFAINREIISLSWIFSDNTNQANTWPECRRYKDKQKDNENTKIDQKECFNTC